MAITTNNLISRQTVGSAGAASVTFSNIPQGFTDLKIVASARVDSAAVYDNLKVSINGSSSAIYSDRLLYGNGTAAASAGNSNSTYEAFFYSVNSNATASVFSNGEIYFPNYTSANYKSYSIDCVTENNAASSVTALAAALWSSTAAITSVTFTPASGNLVEFSTFSLYGISSNTTTQNTSVPSATGGDVITTDGTYWYHQFLYSGTFTPTKALTADYLVLAGGAAGGYAGGAGGGAGGFRCTVTATGGGGSLESALSLTAQAYTVTIGAGGAGQYNVSVPGNNGSNSVFSTITSTGGGGGGGNDGAVAPVVGGSGGGGSYNTNGALGTANQGYRGGNSSVSGYAAGGGGAGAVGANTSGTIGGAGGAGVASTISGSSVTRGGGGGSYGGAGGAGGSGGGGAGGGTGTAGTANTGGGGGGNAANGGSGIVIVRYAV